MPPDASDVPSDLRCDCGALLARKVPEGVELRCRRCRRSVILSLADLTDGPRVVSPCRPDGLRR